MPCEAPRPGYGVGMHVAGGVFSFQKWQPDCRPPGSAQAAGIPLGAWSVDQIATGSQEVVYGLPTTSLGGQVYIQAGTRLGDCGPATDRWL